MSIRSDLNIANNMYQIKKRTVLKFELELNIVTTVDISAVSSTLNVLFDKDL